jgi:hypothetical protein
MERDYRRRREDASYLPFGFAPQVLPALQVAEWLTGRFNGRRHKVRPGRR